MHRGNKGKCAKNESCYACHFRDCKKLFKTKFSLKRHSFVHTLEKKFKCPHCGKDFRLLQYLKEHIFIHTGAKPYICGVGGCQESFRQTGKLALHRKTHKEYVSKPKNLKKFIGRKDLERRKVEWVEGEALQSASMEGEKEFEWKCANNGDIPNDMPRKNLRRCPRKDSVQTTTTLDYKENKARNNIKEPIQPIKEDIDEARESMKVYQHISVEAKDDFKVIIKFGLGGNENSGKSGTIGNLPTYKTMEEVRERREIDYLFLDYLSHINSETFIQYRPVLPKPDILKNYVILNKDELIK